jgi:hypothetical protein
MKVLVIGGSAIDRRRVEKVLRHLSGNPSEWDGDAPEFTVEGHEVMPCKGMPIDAKDKHGNPIHIDDVLAFDGEEWSGIPGSKPMLFSPTIEKGQIAYPGGGTTDFEQFCEIIKTWDGKEPQVQASKEEA